jgi:gliding motility-associated-like protein
MKHLKTILLFLFVMFAFGQTNQTLDICSEESKTEYTYSVNSDTPNTTFYWYVDGVYYFGQTLTVDWSTYTSGFHTITVYGFSDGCKSLPVSYKVFIGECSTIYIPNAFTPNADGINDTWFPIGEGWESIEVLVFDRWGELVFKSVDPKGQWIGNFRGGDYYVQIDVYEYKVTWKGYDKEPEVIFGHVTVVR